MGWDVGGSGLQIVLGAEVPDLVHTYLADDVTGFLKRHDLTIGDIARWICHPGGPKVIEAIQDTLGLERERPADHLGFAAPDRQPVVRLGPARPAGHAAGAARRSGRLSAS